MRSSLSRLNKKGISEILSYVLLVVLAVGMGAAVYSYIAFQIPKDREQCNEGVSVVIREATCTDGVLSVTLLNKGLFTVHGFYLKAGVEGEVYKPLINCPNGENSPGCEIIFIDPVSLSAKPLLPDETITKQYLYPAPGTMELELIPAQTVNNKFTLCTEATVKKTVACFS